MILNFSNWQKLYEQADDGLSNVNSKMAFVGATYHTAPNTNALKQFMSSLPDAKVDGEIDETKALFRSREGSTGFWKTGAKTQKAKDYLKIGDRVLNGEGGKPTSIIINSDDLIREPIEASGNGIFALGRAISMRRTKKFFEGRIIIGMNTKSADSFVVNANTAFQTSQASFAEGVKGTFIVSKAIIPSDLNKTQNVNVYRKMAKDGKDPNVLVNQQAMPTIQGGPPDSLYTVASIDATSFVDKIKEKKLTTYFPEVAKYVDEYADTFFEPFLTTWTERFKSFLKIRASEAGIDASLFGDLMKYVEDWKTKQSKDAYKKRVEKEVKGLFAQIADRGSVSRPGASASTEQISGTVGKIGQ
jgi:hypothetical protein